LSQQQSRLNVVSPTADSTVTADTVVYFRGLADPAGVLFLNGEEVPVYSTGVFAAPLYLQEGTNELQIRQVVGNDTLRKRMVVVAEKPMPPQPTAGFSIEYVRIMP